MDSFIEACSNEYHQRVQKNSHSNSTSKSSSVSCPCSVSPVALEQQNVNSPNRKNDAPGHPLTPSRLENNRYYKQWQSYLQENQMLSPVLVGTESGGRGISESSQKDNLLEQLLVAKERRQSINMMTVAGNPVKNHNSEQRPRKVEHCLLLPGAGKLTNKHSLQIENDNQDPPGKKKCGRPFGSKDKVPRQRKKARRKEKSTGEIYTTNPYKKQYTGNDMGEAINISPLSKPDVFQRGMLCKKVNTDGSTQVTIRDEWSLLDFRGMDDSEALNSSSIDTFTLQRTVAEGEEALDGEYNGTFGFNGKNGRVMIDDTVILDFIDEEGGKIIIKGPGRNEIIQYTVMGELLTSDGTLSMKRYVYVNPDASDEGGGGKDGTKPRKLCPGPPRKDDVSANPMPPATKPQKVECIPSDIPKDTSKEGRRQGRKKRLASQPETNPADQQRIDAAVAAVNERYGTGAERQEKLSTVKFRGVTCRPSGKWQAQVYYGGKSRYVGVFDLEAEAALAYEAARELLEKSASGKDVCREKLTLGCSVGVTDDAMEIASNVSLARKAAFAIVS